MTPWPGSRQYDGTVGRPIYLQIHGISRLTVQGELLDIQYTVCWRSAIMQIIVKTCVYSGQGA
jgi:hypothetical protein